MDFAVVTDGANYSICMPRVNNQQVLAPRKSFAYA